MDDAAAHFVTFSCYKRRRILDPDPCKRIVIGILGSELKAHGGYCAGFVIMPNHVHAALWFDDEKKLSPFMNKWKENSSKRIHARVKKSFPKYLLHVPDEQRVWQIKYHDFNVRSEKKLEEKVSYMHENPVRTGLTADANEWPWSSARFWEQSRPVGIPIEWPS